MCTLCMSGARKICERWLAGEGWDPLGAMSPAAVLLPLGQGIDPSNNHPSSLRTQFVKHSAPNDMCDIALCDPLSAPPSPSS